MNDSDKPGSARSRDADRPVASRVDARPSRRGRPREFDVEHAVSAARELFGRRGYEGVGVNDVCAAVGIRPPSFYAAFGNKRGLFERAVDAYAIDVGRRFSRALGSATTPDELWRRLLRAAARVYGEGPAAGCLVLEHDRSSAAEVRELTGRHVDATLAGIEARLVALGCDDAGEEARAILVVMRGLSASARTGTSGAALLRTVDRVVAQRTRSSMPRKATPR